MTETIYRAKEREVPAEALECTEVHSGEGQTEVQYYGYDNENRKCLVGRLGVARLSQIPRYGAVRVSGEWLSKSPFMVLEGGGVSHSKHAEPGTVYAEHVPAALGEPYRPKIRTTFVSVCTVIDPVSGGEVEVEIRRLESGAMVGIDGSYLQQMTDEDSLCSPYDRGYDLEIPEDEDGDE